jgi:hypothetical protein
MRRLALAVALALLASCAAPPERTPAAVQVAPFSKNPVDALPVAWQPFRLARHKAATDYRTAFDTDAGRVVLRARAARSASGLKQRLNIDPRLQPRLRWHWRVPHLIEGADNTDRHAEDSRVRVLLFFDGDRAALPARERAALDLAELVSGHPAPYATLMYIWANRQPVDTLITSPFTARVQMIVASSGDVAVGRWVQFERDYLADYRRAFGAEPGRLIGVGVLTDTDNTGAAIEAYYGDIELEAVRAR